MGVRNMGAKRSFAHLLEIGSKKYKFVVNLKSGTQFRWNWFNSCIDSLFAGMTPTVHKNQVHYLGVVQGWVCSSLMSAVLPVCRGKLRTLRADCSTVGFYCFNNNMATNLHVLTSSYGRRQGCQFGFFEAKFVIFGLFSTPFAFLHFSKKAKCKWNLAFLAFFGRIIFMSIWEI